MGKIWQISTEFGPLIDLEIGFHSLSLAFFYRFSLNWVYELILKSSVLVLQMDKFRQINKYRVMALD